MTAFLLLRSRSGRLLRIRVVRANRRRRRGTVKAMRIAGWPWWRIAAALKVRRERVETLDVLSALFDAPTLAAIRREAAHVLRRAR